MFYPSKAIDADSDSLSYTLTQAPGSMVIDPTTGKIIWQTYSANAGNNYPVTILVSDGRGATATQSFTVSVTTAGSALGALYGTKYSDADGNGLRDSTAPTSGGLAPIALLQAAITVVPYALDYHQPTNSMVIEATSNGSTGIYRVQTDGTTLLYATLSGVSPGDGSSLTTVRSDNTGGFTVGDIFVAGVTSSPQIIRVTNGGATVAEASVFLYQLLRLRPSFAEDNQLGLALAAQGRYAEAEACYREALRLDAKSANTHSNLGNAHQEQGRLDEALACYDLALWLDPASANTHWNRALSILQKGDFERGWKEYEWRWQRKQTPARPFAQPRWDGSPLEGRTLLIYMEQGLGDMLMFIRYAGLVRSVAGSGDAATTAAAELAEDRGGKVVVECPAFLLPLLSRSRRIDQVVAEGTTLPDFDVQAPLMSLPGLCGTTLATLPADVPYLFADERLIERWRQWLHDACCVARPESSKGVGASTRPSKTQGVPPGYSPHRDLNGVITIGIVWQGNPRHGLDRYRSIPLRAFAPLAGVAGVQLVSLQKGFGSEQVRDLAGRFSILEPPGGLEPTAQAFVDTAALMMNLDLVISVYTATAHLVGWVCRSGCRCQPSASGAGCLVARIVRGIRPCASSGRGSWVTGDR